MRWGRIMMAGSVLPVFILVVSLLGATALSRLSAASPQLAQFAQFADVVMLTGGVAALIFYLLFVYRLKAWERGVAVSCAACSGPLGLVRPGKVYFGRQLTDYRTCYSCGKRNSER